MNNSKVTDHHAIIPTMELASSHLDELKSWEEKILFLIAVHTVMAMSKDHIYQETEIEVECQGEIFKAKGKIVPGLLSASSLSFPDPDLRLPCGPYS